MVDRSLKKTLAGLGMWWDEVLLDISVGLFISGILLFVLTALLLGLHGFGDKSVDGHEIDGQDIGHDISDHDIDGDHDFSHDMGGHEDVHSETSGDSAPIILLVSTFMLSFGAMGISLFQIQMDSLIRALIIFSTPVVVTVIVSNIWKKIAKSELGAHVHPKELIGRTGTIVHQTTYRGGSVRVTIEGVMGSILLPAKSYEVGEEFYKGDQVKIVAAEGTTCLVKRI